MFLFHIASRAVALAPPSPALPLPLPHLFCPGPFSHERARARAYNILICSVFALLRIMLIKCSHLSLFSRICICCVLFSNFSVLFSHWFRAPLCAGSSPGSVSVLRVPQTRVVQCAGAHNKLPLIVQEVHLDAFCIENDVWHLICRDVWHKWPQRCHIEWKKIAFASAYHERLALGKCNISENDENGERNALYTGARVVCVCVVPFHLLVKVRENKKHKALAKNCSYFLSSISFSTRFCARRGGNRVIFTLPAHYECRQLSLDAISDRYRTISARIIPGVRAFAMS